VKRLRIELTGKCFDLLLINDVGSARKALADVEIIEIESFHRDRLANSGDGVDGCAGRPAGGKR